MCIKDVYQMYIMAKLSALSFDSYEDFEICNETMNIKRGDTATSHDGMFTVIVHTPNVPFPSGTLVVTAKDGRKIFVRVISGTRQIVTK